jgi:aminoglycoside 6-adenylyltransferase
VDHQQLERRVADWARTRPDLSAAIVVGSRARADHPADPWSDLDLILFVADPAAYIANPTWLPEIGPLWLAVPHRTGRGDPEWMALFEDGLKADFVLARDAGDLRTALDRSHYGFVLSRGFRVLLDRAPAGAPPHQPALQRAPPPGAQAFETAIHTFLLAATRVARALKRGELWPAKLGCDGELKIQLQTMMEWHARAAGVPEREIWHDGRFLEEWADPGALAALPATFAAYDLDDLSRALLATLDLYRRLARETAARWSHPYPVDAERRVTRWITGLLAE